MYNKKFFSINVTGVYLPVHTATYTSTCTKYLGTLRLSVDSVSTSESIYL
jgi:hypothetical protein